MVIIHKKIGDTFLYNFCPVYKKEEGVNLRIPM